MLRAGREAEHSGFSAGRCLPASAARAASSKRGAHALDLRIRKRGGRRRLAGARIDGCRREAELRVFGRAPLALPGADRGGLYATASETASQTSETWSAESCGYEGSESTMPASLSARGRRRPRPENSGCMCIGVA